MNNKSVQEPFCTEPKGDTEEAFLIAIEYEEGIQQHQTQPRDTAKEV